MMNRIGSIVAIAALALVLADRSAAAHSPEDLMGQWRMTRAVVAPWAEEGEAKIERAWIGKNIVFKSNKVKGPGPVACANAQYEATSMPAEGLFQGGLPAPAVAAAQALGVAKFPVSGMSLACDTGVFEFHQAGTDALLFALDNVIWTLDRSPGSRAAAQSPEGVTQRFLEAHFNGDMGFDRQTAGAKAASLSRGLQNSIKTYFAAERPEDEVPPVDGDPFTDSQEYPTRFSVALSEQRGRDRATVPVIFSDGFRDRRVVYRLIDERSRWRIDDLQYEDGGTLSEMLAP
jgi:hypothetical protein